MKVILAGHTVDKERLEEFRARAREIRGTLQDTKSNAPNDVSSQISSFLYDLAESQSLTPETLSAAYARISRDPRPVDELRRIAAIEVGRARKSNETIIFGMGHASVAEHAVFNLDIIDISRLATEEIQRARLASFTEKSQRYIKLTGDYLVPDETKTAGFGEKFDATVKSLFETYNRIYYGLLPMIVKNHPDLAEDVNGMTILDGWAKEDARFILPLCAYTQMGMTANARTLEMTIRRLAAHPLHELRSLSRHLFDVVSSVAPSVIRYTTPTKFDLDTPELIKKSAPSALGADAREGRNPGVTLIDYPEDGDDRLAAALLFSFGDRTFGEIKKYVSSLSPDEKEKIISSSLLAMEAYDRALREFELVQFTFEAIVSASCFAQLKRHRMATILTQKYDLTLGVEIPKQVEDAGLIGLFEEGILLAEDFHATLMENAPASAPYILTNAHRRRVIFCCNLRELYHISRLRMDGAAQWEIRSIATSMVNLAQKVLPLSTALACGKDSFAEHHKRLIEKFET